MMIGTNARHLEQLIRLEMKPFELCLDLMEIRVKRYEADWKVCIDSEIARQHPDCFAALTRAVLMLKRQFFLEDEARPRDQGRTQHE